MSSHPNQAPLRSGELAKLAKISTDTLRHYERIGVLPRPKRTPAGYRQYPAESVDRVLLIRQALAVGFSLPELAVIFRVRESGGAPCRKVLQLAQSKLAQVEQQLRDLQILHSQLQLLIQDWDARIANTPKGQPARLLETLIQTASPSPPRKGLLR